VSLLCRMRPIGVMYSDIMLKFYRSHVSCVHTLKCPLAQATHLVVIQRIYAELIQDVVLRPGLPTQFLPFGHFHPTQVMRCVHIAGLPSPCNLSSEILGRVCALGIALRLSFVVLCRSAGALQDTLFRDVVEVAGA
jgi:hypothetical protein